MLVASAVAQEAWFRTDARTPATQIPCLLLLQTTFVGRISFLKQRLRYAGSISSGTGGMALTDARAPATQIPCLLTIFSHATSC